MLCCSAKLRFYDNDLGSMSITHKQYFPVKILLMLLFFVLLAGGSFGEVGVVLSTAGGGETWDRKLLSSADALTDLKLRIANNKLKRASAGLDYEIRDTNVTFQVNVSCCNCCSVTESCARNDLQPGP